MGMGRVSLCYSVGGTTMSKGPSFPSSDCAADRVDCADTTLPEDCSEVLRRLSLSSALVPRPTQLPRPPSRVTTSSVRALPPRRCRNIGRARSAVRSTSELRALLFSRDAVVDSLSTPKISSQFLPLLFADVPDVVDVPDEDLVASSVRKSVRMPSSFRSSSQPSSDLKMSHKNWMRANFSPIFFERWRK